MLPSILIFIGASLSIVSPNYLALSVLGLCGVCVGIYSFSRSVVVLLRTKREVGLLVINAGALFWFWYEVGFLALSDPVFANTESWSAFSSASIPADVIAKALFILSSFTISAHIAHSLLGNTAFFNSTKGARFSHRKTSWLDGLLLVISMLGWLPLIESSGGIAMSLERLTAMRADHVVEVESGFMGYLAIFSLCASSYALIRLASKSTSSRLLAICAFTVGAAIVVFSGTRFRLLYLIAPAIFVLFFSSDHRGLTKRQIIFIVIGAMSLFLLAYFQINSRDGGYGSKLNAFYGNQHFSAFTFAVGLVPSLEEHFYQPLLPFFVTDYIPRFLWPDKPLHTFWEFYNGVLIVNGFGNVTPSVLGQYYMNWGLFGGFIAGFIFGFWAKIIDKFVLSYIVTRSPYSVAMAAYVSVFLFLSFRVLLPSYFFYILVMYLFLLILRKTVKS